MRRSSKIKKIIFLLVLATMICGCSFFRKRAAPAVNNNKPYEPAVTRSFKSTPKEDAKTCQRAGLNLFEQNYWDEAQVYFIKALNLEPKLYMSWYCLGIINIDKEKGYADLKKSAEIKPDFAPAYYWMAYYQCRNREDQKAIPLFKKYLEVARDDLRETDRIEIAREVLQDLLTGREGRSLSLMRGKTEEKSGG